MPLICALNSYQQFRYVVSKTPLGPGNCGMTYCDPAPLARVEIRECGPMELADGSLIDALIRGNRRIPARPPQRMFTFDARPAPKGRRCSCGVCRGCIENARWERIFREKFADPNYYNDGQVRRGSSLSWL